MLSILKKYRTLVWLVFLGAVGASLAVSLLLPPVYEASTTLLVESGPSLQNPLSEVLNLGQPRVANMAGILSSRSLLYNVASRYDLVTTEDPEELDKLSRKISVRPIPGTNLIKIRMEYTDPEIARNFVNDWAEEFILQNQQLLKSEARGGRRFLEEQLESVGRELAEAEDALRQYRQEQKVFDPAEEVRSVLSQLTRLETMEAETTVAQREVATKLDKITAQLSGEQAKVIASTTISRNPSIQTLKNQLVNLEVELSGAREKYTDKHPSVVALNAQIAEVKAKMKLEADRVVSTETETLNPRYQDLYRQVGQLQVELLALDVRKNTLDRLIAGKERTFREFPEKELELTNLVRNAKVTEGIYNMLKQKYEEVRLAEVMTSANIRVIDKALLPTKPVRPNLPLNIAVAALLGLFIGVGLAFLLESNDTSVKTPEDVEAVLGLPVLGQIPEFKPNPAKSRTARYMALAIFLGLFIGVSLAFTIEFITKSIQTPPNMLSTLSKTSTTSENGATITSEMIEDEQ